MKATRHTDTRFKVGKAQSTRAVKKTAGAVAKAQWVVSTDNAGHIKGLTAADKINIIRAGVSKKQLTEIKEEMDLDYDELSEVLSTSRATLIKKKNTEKFDSQISERIVLLNDVLAYGREVFEDNDNFNEWLRTPSLALGNVTPLSMMDTLYGIDEVKKEIGRIAYGVY
jgi:putative toxin-antitoxin system antitoxin component (TIGR02293 family)